MHNRPHNNRWLWLAALLLAGCSTTPPPPVYGPDHSAPETPVPPPDAARFPLPAHPKIAIIIDDIGNNRFLGLQAAGLQGKVTLSVMPHTPHGRDIAIAAHALGKELMLHMPMSNTADKFVTADTLHPGMSHDDFTAMLDAAIASVPYIRGVNNHTGSALTAMPEPMHWFMQDIGCYDLYFIDSRTTADSVAEAEANAAGIPNNRRHVFLDNEISREAIDIAFRRLLRIARSQGEAIGIGHPHPETLAYLNEAIAYLPAMGIDLVFASELVHDPLPQDGATRLNPAPQAGNLVGSNQATTGVGP